MPAKIEISMIMPVIRFRPHQRRFAPADVRRLGAGEAPAWVRGDQPLAQVQQQLVAAHLGRQ